MSAGKPSLKSPSPAERVEQVMAAFAARGVFGGYAAKTVGAGRRFHLKWHRNREFILRFDPAKSAFKFDPALPGAAATTKVYKDFRAFVRNKAAAEQPAHRLIDPEKVEMKVSPRGGDASLTLISKDGDLEYAAQRLIALVHETYLIFLSGPSYTDYKAEHLGAEPDWG